ncbi:ceramide synthase 1-like isoform X2 [Oncorhynchus masou masou]|uniref:ceramide synthase 1-like isoform X2 n=1 Tax=Oncorhynchus masou masou TaxID=90313 RepID=UPI0031832CE1
MNNRERDNRDWLDLPCMSWTVFGLTCWRLDLDLPRTRFVYRTLLSLTSPTAWVDQDGETNTQPFAQWCSLQPKDSAKMPESSWKLVFYTMSWSYSTYLLFFTNYTFFHDPPSVFYEWKRGMTVPTDIAIAYLIQGSFYGHSIYATVYMDAWRKDSTVMVVHHVITLALITFSYAFRFHNIGLLVLFLHDINDIQLEFTKLNVYFKTRGGGYYLINDVLSNMGSVSFSITWFWFRLYWFPLKVLYATCVSSLQSVPNIPFYFFFNSLLLTLLCMNIYWFLYIVAFVAKVLTGQMKDVKDLREYEGEEGAQRAATLLKAQQQSKDAGHLNNSAETQLSNSTEGKHLQNGITKEKHL